MTFSPPPSAQTLKDDAARHARHDAAVAAIFAKHGEELTSRAVQSRWNGWFETGEIAAIIAELSAAEAALYAD